MIIKGSNPKKTEEVPKTEEEQKEELLNELRKESLSVISLACIYVKKFEETGIDVTERWATTEIQSEMIQKFFYQGYEKGLLEGIEKGKQIEKEEQEEIERENYGQKDEFFDPNKMTARANRHRRKATKKKRRY